MTSKRIDYAVYRVLARLIGEDRAEPFHPLNRHPVHLSDIPAYEVVGGPDDGRRGIIFDFDRAKNVGGSRLLSWLRLLWPANYREAREALLIN